ncbi:MAG: iron-siderophore ABC transporter substrate-binding protein [Patulibacter minatonensis]
MTHLRRLAALLAAVTVALVLAACGSDDSSTGAGASTSTTAGTGFPVTVEHKYGSTTIGADPKRVIALGYTDQDPVLSVGVKPVGVGDFLGGYDWRTRPWAKDLVGGSEPKVVAGQQINFDAVAAARPDLIFAINAGLKKADYDKLSKIAPTVAQSGDFIDFGMPWDQQQLLVGRALGREAQAQKVVDDLKTKFKEVKESHPEFAGKTAIMAYGGSDGYGAYSTQDNRSRFLSDLGFKTPTEIDEIAGDSFFAAFSQEQFRLLDQDIVFMYGDEADIKKNPVVSRLKAVREGRVIYIPIDSELAGGLGFASALSESYLLGAWPEQFALALDGDPATKVTQPE